ncbi:hypothetical protein [Cryobacterium sp. 5B3]|uniref:hypothetical protein n=1 Tax=Cryobacterium sp. 5B3 TaxID=3048586 RepID=UPI002AB5BB99|nr:hypothetical protein [Cryobacterium sp. 5B3]MDY7541819.1 hypothetical protein [Cryobacterium sp. 5B3]MEB0276358.1 hypothetical protein [Cryobacterium sp. 5B3]
MENIGIAEMSLGLVGLLFVLTVAFAGVAMAGRRGQPLPLVRARRVSALRSAVAVSIALAVFAVAILIHIANPLLELVPFFLGPLAAAAAGLIAFTLMPAPTIDGALRRRTSNVQPRTLRDYSTSGQRARFCVIVGLTALVAVGAGLLSKSAPDGRSLCTALFPAECKAGGPYLFPGWMFALPVLVLSCVLVLAAVQALRRVVDAPATAWAELSDADTALRRSGVRLVFRVASAPLALTLGLLLGMASLPLVNAPLLETGLDVNAAVTLHTIGMVLFGAAPVALVYGLTLAFLAVIGAIKLPRTASAGPRSELAE